MGGGLRSQPDQNRHSTRWFSPQNRADISRTAWEQPGTDPWLIRQPLNGAGQVEDKVPVPLGQEQQKKRPPEEAGRIEIYSSVFKLLQNHKKRSNSEQKVLSSHQVSKQNHRQQVRKSDRNAPNRGIQIRTWRRGGPSFTKVT